MDGHWVLYLQALGVIVAMMTLLWVISVLLKNASIVDPFWGTGFVVTVWLYFALADGYLPRQVLVVALTTVWGLRLSLYLGWRNWGKGEDFRYREFRQKYGPERYWWVSFLQVFLLQGLLMWLISAPLLGAQTGHAPLNALDWLGVGLWFVGMIFEAGGDWQLARFKSDPANKGKLLASGLWRYTRHPNYFGDSAVWWGYGMICLGAGQVIPLIGAAVMTVLIVKVSGVALLERSLENAKPGYEEYVRRTSAFFPWFPQSK